MNDEVRQAAVFPGRSALKTPSRKARLLGAVLGIAAVLLPGVAAAWKPTSHVYFAEIAANDALDDGYVDIPILNTGEVRSYKVDERTLQALQGARAQYRAGVLGPDAYPDILSGQQVIHPAPHESQVPDGSNGWLEYVWG